MTRATFIGEIPNPKAQIPTNSHNPTPSGTASGCRPIWDLGVGSLLGFGSWEFSSEPLVTGAEDLLDADFLHAVVMAEGADPLEAGAALDLVAHDRVVPAEGRGDDPVGRAEDGDHR